MISIYAATPQSGRASWVRDYPLADIQRYESEMLAYLRDQHAEILDGIRASGRLDEDGETKLAAALDAFAKIFAPSRSEAAA